MNMPWKPYFETLLTQLCERPARATLSQVMPSHPAFRAFLREQLEQLPGHPASFLSQPVFEALFEYEGYSKTLEETGLLHSLLLRTLDSPPKEHWERRFPKDRRPYVHQVKAWQALKEQPARSVIVSTGTASGKTECFLIPILDDLVREYEENQQRPLVGVRALFLYPLNALINSQQERLSAWTAGLNDGIRFCLYNGATPDSPPKNEQAARPEQVLSRKLLRDSPPPILVTNSTMLEYMLVRKVDAPIVQKSQGKLRWIVLDEAHTYLGSNAAEISLLLRRVMHAFNADPKQVRFVATSATMGSGEESKLALQRFLADLAGFEPSQVTVIGGRRLTPPLKPGGKNLSLPSIEELRSMADYDNLRTRLERVPEIRELRTKLSGTALTLDEINRLLKVPGDQKSCVQILDACSENPPDKEKHSQPLLPLRGNFFLRTQPGLWACCNGECSGRKESLSDESWPFGPIYYAHRQKCQHCSSLVFEVVTCTDCGEVYLGAHEDSEFRLHSRSWDHRDVTDELRFQMEEESDERQDESAPDEAKDVVDGEIPLIRRLIVSRPANDLCDAPTPYDLQTGEYKEGGQPLTTATVENHGTSYITNCICCGGSGNKNWEQFRPVRLGAQFFLGVSVPTLLAQAPPIKGAKERLPLDGRQMITFTDSRQGTARFAVRAQLESERNFVRSFIYHKLWSLAATVSPEDLDKQKKQVAALRTVVEGNPGLQPLFEQESTKLDELQRRADAPSASVKWRDMIDALAKQAPLQYWLPEATRLRYRQAIDVSSQLAEMFLLREFFRRPRRQNSMETLGLGAVSFPQLAQCVPPTVWRITKKTATDWHSFLKLCVDFGIRGNACVSVRREYLRWIGIKIRPRYMASPDQELFQPGLNRWPVMSGRTGRTHRLITMLQLALQLNLEDPDHITLIDSLLRDAWGQIVGAGILIVDTNGYQLNLELAEVTLVPVAYRCPVTQRLLDNVLCGVSPYHSERTFQSLGPVKKVLMPRLMFPFKKSPVGEVVSIETVSRWLKSDELAAAAREEGTWTEFCDRIAEESPFLEAAEHSGQMSKSRLIELEKRFRLGKTNLLNCSTTMEMGIDIGGLTCVAMNNAPPGPANWLQRAGRAGRRDIARASTLTLCQSQPHGLAVFQNPKWPFTTPIHVPKVSLNSVRIVRRHVQAFLLSQFLADQTDNSTKLLSKWFFDRENNAKSRCDHFLSWLQEGAELRPDVEQGIGRLVARSTLETTSRRRLLDDAHRAMWEISSIWLAEREAIRTELAVMGAVPKEERKLAPEQKAVNHQLRRHEEEYLLRELAASGFLPSHGFPLYVLPFVNTSVEQLLAEKDSRDDDRDDSRFQLRSYPSRELATAIREYAPGNSVVIDGLTYTSAGLTLHWQLPPADTGFQESQAIRHVWKCKSCGAFGTSGSRQVQCGAGSCQSANIDTWEYIQPSGFAVDIRTGGPNSLENVSVYVPPRTPFLSCDSAEWVSMPNPALGKFRSDPNGKIFHYSTGAAEHGYAVCLRCGRAASEVGPASQEPLAPFAQQGPHPRLRTGRKEDQTHECPGSDGQFSIKRNLWLAGEIVTDVLQIRLTHPSPTKESISENVAVSLAVAFRSALCRLLGVEQREIGWSVQGSVADDQFVQDIFLFDAAAGGAGYVSSAAGLIQKVIHDAEAILKGCSCDSACHSCLLDFDTQHHADSLNRVKALEWLDEEFMLAIAVPEKFQCFGKSTKYEAQPAIQAILMELQQPGVKELTVFTNGSPASWDLEEWRLYRHIAKLAVDKTGVMVNVAVPRTVRQSIPWTTLHAMASRCEATGMKLLEVADSTTRQGDGYLCAQVISAAGSVQFAVFNTVSLEPGSQWGVSDADSLLVRSDSNEVSVAVTGNLISLAVADSERPNLCSVFMAVKELDGTISDVGEKFWSNVFAVAPWLKDWASLETPESIHYSDRYLVSPLSSRVLFEILNHLILHLGHSNSKPRLVLKTMKSEERQTGSSIHHNWSNDRVQESVLKKLLSPLVKPNPTFSLTRKDDVPHARTLRIEWPDKRVAEITLDQGVGFTRTLGYVPHDFQAKPEDQIEALMQPFSVAQASSRVPFYVMRGK